MVNMVSARQGGLPKVIPGANPRSSRGPGAKH